LQPHKSGGASKHWECVASNESNMATDLKRAVETIQHDFGKPVLGVPPGASVRGRVVRIERATAVVGGTAGARSDLAVIDAKSHMAFIGVPAGSGAGLLGRDVQLTNEHGCIMVRYLQKAMELER
jgi:hypothetical protein